MSYDGKLMRRAMVRFEEAKQRRADALHARERAVYAAVPRIAEIDAALRETMSKLISSALRRGTDPRPAIEALKEENLALQRERAELLVAHGYPADYLEDKPNCPPLRRHRLARQRGLLLPERLLCLRPARGLLAPRPRHAELRDLLL